MPGMNFQTRSSTVLH
ncbi:hypothetical protein [Otoolea muris]